MSEDLDKQKSNNEEKKKTRRTRKDEEGRNFTCPCGKSYLSYPALYTHIKTKHQGKALKEDNGAASKPEIEEESEQRDPLAQIKQMVDKYFPGDDPEAYPTPLSPESDQLVKELIAGWEADKESKQDPANNINETIWTIFGRFLYEMKGQVKAQGFLFLCEFIKVFYDSINEDKKDKQYCRCNTGAQLPNFFNDFVLKKKNPSTDTRRGSPVNNLALTCKLLYFLGMWVFDQRYTNLVVKFNAISG